jgi:hypothetical protein
MGGWQSIGSGLDWTELGARFVASFCIQCYLGSVKSGNVLTSQETE